MKADRKEILRYLGCRQDTADQKTLNRIESCIAELKKNMVPRCVYRRFQAAFEKDTVIFNHLHINSKDLYRHIKGCKEVILFAATLGARVDFLLERTSKTDMSRAVILQASAAAMIEGYCDERQDEIASLMKSQNLFLRRRFSPGYGDFSIQYQKDILNMLDCFKKIGLTMTDSYMLAPTKSITAVIGLTDQKTVCELSKCAECQLKDCSFRKE